MGKYTAIDDPSAYFQTATYTGTGSSLSITNDGNSDLKPDICWIKTRSSSTYNHVFTDSSRGSTKVLVTQGTNAEADVTNSITSYNTDGFTLGDWAHVNYSGVTYVGWQWKANGGTTSSLSNTGPDSVVQVNSDAKFVIGTYTGNGSNSNVKHGLGETPDMLIVKRRTGGTGSWAVWHKDLTSAYWLRLDATVTQATGVWDGLDPNSEKFFISGGSSNVNISGSDYVFYAWKSVQGYSKFGKYAGNENANGPFIYTGFKPACIILKNATVVSNWRIFDTKRPTYNTALRLMPNSTAAEQTDTQIDILSNGFKIRASDSEINSGATHVYMAFAENPFVTSTGIMGTAR